MAVSCVAKAAKLLCGTPILVASTAASVPGYDEHRFAAAAVDQGSRRRHRQREVGWRSGRRIHI